MGLFSDITAAKPQQSQPQQSGGGITDWLPTIGGVVGGVGGGILGSLLGPGFGTVGGAVGGSSLGQGAGEYLRQLITGQHNTGDIAKQAGLGALYGAGGELLGVAAKGVGIAGKAAAEAANRAAAEGVGKATGKIATDAAGQTIEKAGTKVQSGLLATLRRSNMNPEVSASVGGPQYGQDIINTLTKRIGDTNPWDAYVKLDPAMNQIESEIQQIAPKVNATVDNNAFTQDLADKVSKLMNNVPGSEERIKFNQALDNEVAKFENHIGQSPAVTADHLLTYKRALNDNQQITKLFTKVDKGNLELSIPEQVRLAAWRSADDTIGQLSPKLKALTVEQSHLMAAAPGLKTASETGKNISILGTEIPMSKNLPPFLRGKAAGSLNRIAQPSSPMLRAGTGYAARALTGGLTQPTQTDQKQPAQATDTGFTGALGQAGSGSGNLPDATPTDAGMLTKNQIAALMIADLAHGGKHIAALETLSKFAVAPDETKLSAASQLRHDNIQTALASLDGAEQNLATAGGAKGILGLRANVPYFGQFLDHAGASYNNTKIEIATQMAKAITGGSRPAQSVIDKYLHSLPDISDTPQYAADKLAKLRRELMVQAHSFKYNDIINLYNAQQ